MGKKKGIHSSYRADFRLDASGRFKIGFILISSEIKFNYKM